VLLGVGLDRVKPMSPRKPPGAPGRCRPTCTHRSPRQSRPRRHRRLADIEHAAGVAVVAVLDHRDVDVDRCRRSQHPVAGDAVADLMVTECRSTSGTGGSRAGRSSAAPARRPAGRPCSRGTAGRARRWVTPGFNVRRDRSPAPPRPAAGRPASARFLRVLISMAIVGGRCRRAGTSSYNSRLLRPTGANWRAPPPRCRRGTEAFLPASAAALDPLG